jgi:hypothetical protein
MNEIPVWNRNKLVRCELKHLKQKDRETKKHRDRETETKKQREIETDRQRERDTEMQTDRHRKREKKFVSEEN